MGSTVDRFGQGERVKIQEGGGREVAPLTLGQEERFGGGAAAVW